MLTSNVSAPEDVLRNEDLGSVPDTTICYCLVLGLDNCTASYGRKIHSELEGIWREAVVIHSEVLPYHFPGGTQEYPG